MKLTNAMMAEMNKQQPTLLVVTASMRILGKSRPTPGSWRPLIQVKTRIPKRTILSIALQVLRARTQELESRRLMVRQADY